MCVCVCVCVCVCACVCVSDKIPCWCYPTRLTSILATQGRVVLPIQRRREGVTTTIPFLAVHGRHAITHTHRHSAMRMQLTIL